MEHKVIFISHNPHEVHLAFANVLGSKILITPLQKLISLTKKIKVMGRFFSVFSLCYGLVTKVNEDILFVDGASSLLVAVGMKWRNKKLILVYLDCDTMFYALARKGAQKKRVVQFFLKYIDAVISVSDLNQSYIPIDVPNAVCVPFPSKVFPVSQTKKPYGLFVGRLDSDKNILNIIKIGLQCPFLEKIIVVGDGTYKKEVVELANANTKLEYVGHTKDVSKYYNECMFLLHLNEHDPHPTVTMEAALCGCFPLLTPTVGTAYLFDEIFTITDMNDFALVNNKIKYFLQNHVETSALLKKSLAGLPTKESSVTHFKHTFTQLVNTLTK